MHKKREPASTADDLLSRKGSKKTPDNAGVFFCPVKKAAAGQFVFKDSLDKANAGLADFLVVEVNQVICASAKSTAALCLLDNDFFTFGVDLQVVVALDLQLPTQFFRQDKRPRLSTRRIMPESFILHDLPFCLFAFTRSKQIPLPVFEKKYTVSAGSPRADLSVLPLKKQQFRSVTEI
mgnify:FL=1